MDKTLQHLYSMRDKVCLVTGGSRGLGEFMAKGFLQAGAKRVYITARNAGECQATAAHLEQYGNPAIRQYGNTASVLNIGSIAGIIGDGFMNYSYGPSKAAYDAEIAEIPMHRWGEENDITGVAIMLCSAAGAFITGQILAVDGGTTLVS